MLLFAPPSSVGVLLQLKLLLIGIGYSGLRREFCSLEELLRSHVAFFFQITVKYGLYCKLSKLASC